jgi:hypothetical protein
VLQPGSRLSFWACTLLIHVKPCTFPNVLSRRPILDLSLRTNSKVLNYRQLEGQDLTDFYKERKDAFSVLKTMLGDRFLDGFVERTVEYQELTTDPEKDAMKKEAYERWCAFLILRNSDQAKYGEVLRDLASQYSLDNDQYPRKTTKAVDCLSNHRHDNAGKPGKNGHGKDQDQASRSGSGNDNNRNSGNGNGTERPALLNKATSMLTRHATVVVRKATFPRIALRKTSPKHNGGLTR